MDTLLPFALLCFTSFFTLTNPLGTMPVFLTMTKGMDDEERRHIVKRATIISFITLLAFTFSGQFLFKFFGISTNGFRIAAGFIILKIGYDMLQARFTNTKLKNKEIKKIILSRPAVEAGEKLGFLPGDMKDKISFNTIDTSTTGVKTVTYTGVDSAGNKSEVQLQVEVTFSGERIVNTGLSKTGCPYVWGSTGPNSFDCSGFTQWVYRQNGIYIPRTSSEQKAAAKK